MGDRELLEAAAKAAGYTLEEHFDANAMYWPWCHELENNWCPLTDDGDALRLAVRLLFEIDMGRGCIAVRHSVGIKILEAFNHDPHAATRRAIVRAAAEIGRSMK